MSKKKLSSAVALTLVAGLFAGCGSQPQSDTAAKGTQPNQGAQGAQTSSQTDKKLEPATIKFWFPSEGDVNDKYFLDAAKEFEQKYPQIKVEVTKLPTANTDVDIKLNAAQLGNDYPDVFSSYLLFIASRGSRGEFADLKPYLDKWDESSDIVSSALDMGKYKGQQLGIGFYPAPEILTYRTDYFKEAGLDPAKPPKNWDELRDYAYKLVKKDASGKVTRAGFDLPATSADVVFKPFMRQAGSIIIDENNEKPAFTDQGAIDAFNFLTKLKDQSIPYNESKKDEFPLMKGNAAMGLINVSQIAKLLASDPAMKDKIAFGNVLENKKKVAFSGYRLFTMGATSKHKDQSWEFIKFLMGKEQMMKRAKDINIPVVRTSLEKDYIALNPKVNAAISEYVKAGKGQEAVPWVSIETKYLNTAYEEAYTGSKSAEQALKDAEAGLNKELQTLYKK